MKINMNINTTCQLTTILFSAVATTSMANEKQLPDLLLNLKAGEVQHLTPDEAADTRGESMKKEVVQYSTCGLRRCTKIYVNDKHLYTEYDDGSVYFVKQ